MLCTLGQEIEWLQDLKVPLHSRLHSVSFRIGKGAASLLLDLPRVADLHQTRQTERATGHVLKQTLDGRLIARRQIHRLIDTETAVRPGPHVFDHFRFDLLLGQVQLKDRVLPGNEQPPGFRLEARPGTGREFTQQLAIEARVNSQTPGDGQHDLPMGDGSTDFFGNVHRGQQRPLLVAGRASAALLAGEGDEHLVLAVGAANSRKPFLQTAALEKGGHRLLDDRPPVAIPGLIPLVGDPPEGVKMLIEQSPQVGGLRIAWAVERPGLDTSGDHGRNREV